MENQKIPCELEAELALIGSILLDENLIIQVSDLLTPDALYDQRNKIIYQTMLTISKEGNHFDAGIVMRYLNTHNKLEAAGGAEYISSIADAYYSVANVDTYVDLITDAYIKRNAIYVLQQLSQEGFNTDVSAFDYVDKAEKAVFELSKARRIQPFKEIDNVVDTVFDMTTRMSEMTDDVIGLDTGFAPLNKYTQGFQPGQLIILAARPAMGKSAFAMNLATNICQYNKNGNASVALFSLEMSAEQICERMYACDASIHLNQIKNGKMSKLEWARFNNSKAKLKKYNLHFDDSANSTVATIRAKCRKLKADGNLDFIVIDYLGLIQTGTSGKGNDSRQEEVRKISLALKALARDLKVPVVVLSQLSRDVEKRDTKRPMLSDLRDSGSIEQDADVVMLLYREDYYKGSKKEVPAGSKKGGQLTASEKFELAKAAQEKRMGEEMPGDASYIEINVAKNRNGQTGTCGLFFYKAFGRFDSPSPEWEEEMRNIAANQNMD